MEEMSEIQQKYFELKDKKKEMNQKLEDARTKNNLLKNLVGQVMSVDNLEKRWENFELAIRDYDKDL